MNKSFTEMLCREPDKVINGDLFFRVPWYERGLTKEDLYAEKAEKESRATFMNTWEHRTFEGEYEDHGNSIWGKLDGLVDTVPQG